MYLLAYWSVLAAVTADSGCIGYVEKPANVQLKFKDTKVQIVNLETNKVQAESEVAPTSGFFRLSYEKEEKVLIRVIAPNGWIFDSTEVESDCSNDIIFNLIGFKYTGTVTSSGSQMGPAGVTVTLSNDDGVHTAETKEGGSFEIGPILPGEYDISAKHPHFSLSAPIKQELTADCQIEQMPSVVGYQITGKIVENGKPIKGVVFSLFKAGKNFGVSLSDSSGVFSFEKIAVGNYQIRASYVDVESGSEFTIEPEEQEIAVSVDNADLMSNFEIVGMSVHGTVLDGNDKELQGVTVQLGAQKSVTNDNGHFELKKIRPGNHELHLISEDYEFDAVQVELSSQKSAIHTISPSRVAVCPTVDHDPAEIRIYKNGDVVQTTRSQRCFYLAPDEYVVGVVPINGQNIHFTPKQISLTVGNEPIKSGVSFSRVYRPLTALVTCLDENDHCQPESISAVLTSQSGDKFDVTVTKENNVLKVSHAGLSPDTYNLQLQNQAWCFENGQSTIKATVEVSVDDSSTTTEIKQTGQAVVISTDIGVEVDIQGETKQLKKGMNNFCFESRQGITVTPKSCHVFDKETYESSKDNPIELKLIKTRQYIVVNVANVGDSDLHLDIKSSLNGLETITPVIDNDKATYTMFAEAGTTIEIRPRSAKLYVQPDDMVITVPSQIESCLTDVRFDALAGLFVRGSTDPIVPGVKVDLVKYGKNEVVDSAQSDDQGAFQFGPLNPHNQYDVQLAHDDYRFQQRTADETNFIFNSFELANIDIVINDENGQLLSDVVVVLSGPDRYRKVVTLGEDAAGQLTLTRLEPGDYYLALEKREYKFEPNQIEMHFAGRKRVEIKALRYQYSAIGQLSSLSQAGLGNAAVQAIGLGDCEDQTEETVTDEKGNFKIIGLTQGCSYAMKIQSNEFLISPSTHQIKIDKADATNIEFSAFKVITNTRISGNVEVCSTCPLKGISATMYEMGSDNTRGAKIERIEINEKTGTFFNFAAIPQNGQMVEIVVTGPDDTQSAAIYADRPHKHRSFTYTHGTNDETKLHDKPGGQLGAALVILAIIVSTCVTKRDFFLAQLTKSPKTDEQSAQQHKRIRR